MLFKPVYLKGKAMAQAKIPMRPPKPPKQPNIPEQPSPSPPPIEESDEDALEEEEDNPVLPILICKRDCKIVYPPEATRKVLTGKVAYYLADDNGVTKFTPKHIFCALKLDKPNRDKYGEYPCVGAHQRFLEKKEKKRGLGYKRHYISQEVGARGLYGVSC